MAKKKAKRIRVKRTHRFDCKVDAQLFRDANAARSETWPNLLEGLFRDIIKHKELI